MIIGDAVPDSRMLGPVYRDRIPKKSAIRQSVRFGQLSA